MSGSRRPGKYKAQNYVRFQLTIRWAGPLGYAHLTPSRHVLLINTPTARSGGILAPTPFAWCSGSYVGSTSVLLLRAPHGEGIKLTP
jgi:hypothetical protein